MSKAISPDEVTVKSKMKFPNYVVDSVNKLIQKNWDGFHALIEQDEIIAEILKHKKCTRDQIFERHLLDFEDFYRAAGWKVTYYKQPYYETADDYFVFKK